MCPLLFEECVLWLTPVFVPNTRAQNSSADTTLYPSVLQDRSAKARHGNGFRYECHSSNLLEVARNLRRRAAQRVLRFVRGPPSLCSHRIYTLRFRDGAHCSPVSLLRLRDPASDTGITAVTREGLVASPSRAISGHSAARRGDRATSVQIAMGMIRTDTRGKSYLLRVCSWLVHSVQCTLYTYCTHAPADTHHIIGVLSYADKQR